MTIDARKNGKGIIYQLRAKNATTGQNWPPPIITANEYNDQASLEVGAKNNYSQPAPLIRP
jgi:hypothetical protein